MVGTIGDVGCFSFFANKNLTTGEGGLVTTKDDELAEKIRIMRSHGMTTLTWDRHKGHSFSYDVVARGYNYRLDEMRAALGIVQLMRVKAGNAKRRELALIYQDRLKNLDYVEVPFLGAPKGSTHHLFPVLLRDGSRRTDFMAALARQGIQTSIHYPPVHRFSSYLSLLPFNHRLALTDEVCSREVTLPLFPHMSQYQLLQVIHAVEAFSEEQHGGSGPGP
jgi:dTDP-4-amino-4,6-dideoxygalactose transaminase